MIDYSSDLLPSSQSSQDITYTHIKGVRGELQ